MREPFPKHTHTNTRYTCVIFYNLEKYVVIVFIVWLELFLRKRETTTSG